MNMISPVGEGRCDAQLDALRAELGTLAAERIFEAEAADFLWDSRVREHYLGQHSDALSDDENGWSEVSRIAVLSLVGRRWYVAICLVDGDGMAAGIVWKLPYASLEEAQFAFMHAR
ncbi:MAG: hypothetical protein ACM3ZV_03870 [Bacillota bacterium]